jgi:hypothetical protein
LNHTVVDTVVEVRGSTNGCASAHPETDSPERSADMRYKLLCTSCMVAAAVIGAAPAYAGPPNAECGNSDPEEGPIATSSPGNAATAPGSDFNEPGVNSTAGGTGNQAYTNAGAPSQYDVACAKVTAAGVGTPIQVSQPTDPMTGETVITNNSRATRDALGVTSHQGKGATK